MKIFNFIVGFIFNLLFASFKKVRNLRRGDTVAEEIALWLILVVMSIFIAFIVKWGFF